jgi:copper homeostasis protein
MSIVSTPRQAASPAQTPAPPLLEVLVVHPRDAVAAQEGGADRLLVVDGGSGGGLSAEPALVSGVCKATDLPVRATLRLNDSYTTTGGELARLAALGEEYVAVGARGVCFGFLDADLNVDVAVCEHLAAALAGVPWTFHRAVDASLETDRAWRQVARLPGVDAVLSAGSVRGLQAGHDELTDRAAADPVVARLLLAGGGLRPEHVPWLVRAGVRQFHVAASVRPGRSWKADVDAGHVRAWRLLLDDAFDRAQGLVPWGTPVPRAR